MIEWIEKATKLKGDFVEIGCGVGKTTEVLLKYASECDKKVIGIDPFSSYNAPPSYTLPYNIQTFKENIKNFNNFVLYQVNSLSKEAEEYLQIPIALAYVDGLQYKGAVLNDLKNVSHAKIIIVDDYNRSTAESQVKEAVGDYIKTNKRKLIDLGRWVVLTK